MALVTAACGDMRAEIGSVADALAAALVATAADAASAIAAAASNCGASAEA